MYKYTYTLYGLNLIISSDRLPFPSTVKSNFLHIWLASFLVFLSLPGSPTYLLLPSYWPLSSLLNQLESALGRWG